MTRDEAIARIDYLLKLRWALIYDGRCPSCEATIEVDVVEDEGCICHEGMACAPGCPIHHNGCPFDAEPKQARVDHDETCPLYHGWDAELLAAKYAVPLGYAVASFERNGLRIGAVGTVRLEDKDV